MNRRSSTPGTSLAMETNPNAAAGLSNRRMSTIPSSQLLSLVFSQTNNEQIEMRQPIKPPVKKVSNKGISQLLSVTAGVAAGVASSKVSQLHIFL